MQSTDVPACGDILFPIPVMRRHVLIFGVVGGLLIATLQYTEYRLVVIEHSVELYGALVALLFAAFGIWLGLRITRRREIIRETIVVKEVLIAPAEIPALPAPSFPTWRSSRRWASPHANSKSSPSSPADSAIERSQPSFLFPRTPSRPTAPAPSTSWEPRAAPRPCSAAKSSVSSRERLHHRRTVPQKHDFRRLPAKSYERMTTSDLAKPHRDF